MKKENRNFIYVGLTLVLFALGMYQISKHREEKNTDKQASKIGKYVYIDSEGTLHTSKCYIGMQVTSDNGESYLKPIYPLDTLKLTSNYLHWFCSYCVSDEDYEHLQRIVKRNTKR